MEAAKEKERKSHSCSICGYTTFYTTSMKNHLLKIDRCGTLDDPEYKKLYEIYVEKKKEAKETVECEICGIVFKCKKSIYKHRKICKGKPKLECEVQKLKQEIAEMKESHKGMINIINNTQNNHLNINVNVFGEESISHLTQEILDTCWKRRDKGQAELLKHIYNSPKNRNLMRDPEKPNYFLTFNGKTYVYDTKDDVYDKMFDKSADILTHHHNQNFDRLKHQIKNQSLLQDIMEYIDKLEDRDFTTRITLRQKIEEALSEAFRKWGYG